MGTGSPEADETAVTKARMPVLHPTDRDPSVGTPVLGLSSEPGEPRTFLALAGTVYDQPEPEQLLELTVIVPARNEEDCLGACLESLAAQSDEIFKLGRDWELIVVDDHSTDRTAEIARGFDGVTLMHAEKLEKGWTGKANAIWTAARKARGRWLLVHRCGYVARAGRSASCDA